MRPFIANVCDLQLQNIFFTQESIAHLINVNNVKAIQLLNKKAVWSALAAVHCDNTRL